MKTRCFTLMLTLLAASVVEGGAKSKAVTETVEYLARTFGKKAAREGTETLARKLEALVARHGDEVLVAARKVGPQACQLVEEAGALAPQTIKLLARHGDEAVWLVRRPRGMAIFVKHGDEAAEVMLRHKGLAEPLLEAHGRAAVRALARLNGQNARRLGMLQAEGQLARAGRADELLAVIGKYGDHAMEFVWKHKGALAMSTLLAAFLADPQPFLDGTRELVGGAVDSATRHVLAPVADTPRQVATEVARRIDWTLVLLAALGLLAAWMTLRPICRRAVSDSHSQFAGVSCRTSLARAERETGEKAENKRAP